MLQARPAMAEQAPEAGIQHCSGYSKKSHCRVPAPACKAFGSTGRRLQTLHKVPPQTFLILQGKSDCALSFLWHCARQTKACILSGAISSQFRVWSQAAGISSAWPLVLGIIKEVSRRGSEISWQAGGHRGEAFRLSLLTQHGQEGTYTLHPASSSGQTP